MLNCCGSIAVDMGEDFRPYYPQMQPTLTGIVAGLQVTKATDAEIRGAAMFALASCMEAVGVEVSGQHAGEYAGIVLRMLGAGGGPDFIPEDTTSMEQCCDVLCKLGELLGESFAGFLPVAVPLLVAKLQKICWATKTVAAGVDVGEEEGEGGAGAGGGASSPTAVKVSFDGTNMGFDPSILATKIDALKGLARLTSSIGVTCKGFYPLVDKLYEVVEFYALKRPEAETRKDDATGEEVVPMYGDDLRIVAIECLTELFKSALADCAPHAASGGAQSHGQYLITRMLTGIFVPLLGNRDHIPLQETLCSTLDELAQLSYESTRPGWKGPPEAEEPLAEVPPGTYRPALIPLDTAQVLVVALASLVAPAVEARQDIIKESKANPCVARRGGVALIGAAFFFTHALFLSLSHTHALMHENTHAHPPHPCTLFFCAAMRMKRTWRSWRSAWSTRTGL